LLGGTESPIGWSVHFLQAPPGSVIDSLRRIDADHPLEIGRPEPYPAVLQRLPPFEAPWTRELVVPCGAWTAYLNNGVDGVTRPPQVRRWRTIWTCGASLP
jgi:hypothetical protein